MRHLLDLVLGFLIQSESIHTPFQNGFDACVGREAVVQGTPAGTLQALLAIPFGQALYAQACPVGLLNR